jgi:shikimate kinase
MNNIFLIGPMGSGKSAVGRRLSRETGKAFVDSDDVIEESTGVDIPFIFDKEGEAGFRQRERQIIDEQTKRGNIILATGGGAIQDPDNRQHLAVRGTVIYLHATVPVQLRRTRRGRERPLLKKSDPAKVLETLMQVRDPLYREIADFVIETDARTVASVCKEIRKRLISASGE